MCGITGMWTSGKVDERVLDAMVGAIVHRGPDDGGAWIDHEASVGLGNRRLAIIDISSAGHQPMVSACGRFVITLNGEIYNHGEIRRELELAGEYRWVGHSDTEILLAAIARWGLEEAIGRAVGMFGLAVWDREERVLRLARDRMGEKPLYYGWVEGAFLFGSELKTLVRYPTFDAPIDRDALDYFVRHSYVPAPLSIYQGVYKLLPGSVLTLRRGAIMARPSGFAGQPVSTPDLSLTPYWSYPKVVAEGLKEPVADTAMASAELERLLIRSVQAQSLADVPVGTFLSGGYDSSTIAALQQHHSTSQVKTFTIGFDELGFDEAPFARRIATHLGTDHHEMRVTSADALAVIPDLPEMYDEPFADASQIPTYLLSKMARQSVTVALSGDGGDELFGGYNRYVEFERYRRLLARMPRPIRSAAAGAIDALGNDRIDRIGRATGLHRRFPQPAHKAQKLARILRSGDRIGPLYTALLSQWDRSAKVVLGVAAANAGQRSEMAGLDGAAQMMLWDAMDYLPDDILCKVDRAAMAASLETRAPFLDHRVVEYMARLPVGMKLGPDGGKWILRQILYKHVPPRLVDRPKAGFTVPLALWLRGPLRDWAEGLLATPRLMADGYFDARIVRDKWETHLAGRRDYSTALWAILIFQSWLDSRRADRFLQRPSRLENSLEVGNSLREPALKTASTQ